MHHRLADDGSSYDAWFDRLRSIAIEEFGITPSDAERLAHDVLLSSLLGDPAKRSGAWLEGAMRSASRRHAGGADGEQ